jgi:hypothetical protein
VIRGVEMGSAISMLSLESFVWGKEWIRGRLGVYCVRQEVTEVES